MGIIKKAFLRIALNRKQRVVLWNALLFSDYKYRCRGMVDRAVVTSTVLSQVEKLFGVNKKKFNMDEVNAIIDDFYKEIKNKQEKKLEEAYQDGVQEGIYIALHTMKHGEGIQVGDTYEEESAKSAESDAAAEESAKGAEGGNENQ